jgi:hypothetical protein
MKLIELIMSALILTACLAANAVAIKDAGSVSVEPGESLADKLIDLSNSPEVYKSDSGFAATPEESKQQWSNRTGVDFTMPESLSAGGNSAKASRAAAEAASSQQTEDKADVGTSPAEETQTATAQSATPSSGAADVKGSWSFTLDESTPKEMMLTLFQSGDAVYGTGSINMGDNTLVAAASGSIDGDSMNLDVTTIGTISLYRIALDLNGDSAQGSYDASAASGDTWTGNVQGGKL